MVKEGYLWSVILCINSHEINMKCEHNDLTITHKLKEQLYKGHHSWYLKNAEKPKLRRTHRCNTCLTHITVHVEVLVHGDHSHRLTCSLQCTNFICSTNLQHHNATSAHWNWLTGYLREKNVFLNIPYHNSIYHLWFMFLRDERPEWEVTCKPQTLTSTGVMLLPHAAHFGANILKQRTQSQLHSTPLWLL